MIVKSKTETYSVFYAVSVKIRGAFADLKSVIV